MLMLTRVIMIGKKIEVLNNVLTKTKIGVAVSKDIK